MLLCTIFSWFIIADFRGKWTFGCEKINDAQDASQIKKYVFTIKKHHVNINKNANEMYSRLPVSVRLWNKLYK